MLIPFTITFQKCVSSFWKFPLNVSVFYRGPLCLLRLELGVLTNGRLGTVELVSEYIKHEQAEEVCSVELNIIMWG